MEKQIQDGIIEYLQWNKIFFYRQNTGAMAVGTGAARRFVRFGTKGCPDIVCVIGGKYVGLEVKSESGRQSPEQKDFQNRLEQAGGKYFVVRSISDVVEALKKC